MILFGERDYSRVLLELSKRRFVTEHGRYVQDGLDRHPVHSGFVPRGRGPESCGGPQTLRDTGRGVYYFDSVRLSYTLCRGSFHGPECRSGRVDGSSFSYSNLRKFTTTLGGSRLLRERFWSTGGRVGGLQKDDVPSRGYPSRGIRADLILTWKRFVLIGLEYLCVRGFYFTTLLFGGPAVGPNRDSVFYSTGPGETVGSLTVDLPEVRSGVGISSHLGLE